MSNCIAVSADGAPAMMGKNNGFLSFVLKQNPNILTIHCLLHRENLAAKHSQADMAIVFQEVVHVVNYIKKSALSTRMFAELCEEAGAEFTCLLFYSKIRWLSKGKVLHRVVSLRNELFTFLSENKHPLAPRFADKIWIAKLVFFADFFTHLNVLNTSMQGRNKVFLEVLEDIEAFKAKVRLWILRMEKGRIAAFPQLNLFLEEEEDLEINDLFSTFQEHLKGFLDQLNKYIPQHGYAKRFFWVRKPFDVSVSEMVEHEEDEIFSEQLVDLQNRQLWKDSFKRLTLTEFWAQVSAQEPHLKYLCDLATEALMPFATTYLCEAGFSLLAMIKNETRNRLQPEDDMRCALSSIEPQIDVLVEELQGQGSH